MPEFISRRRFTSAVGGAFVAVAGAPTLGRAWAVDPDATSASTTLGAAQYGWKSVKIGGGGFVDGIIFNQSQANLIYARTDIGGAYRWDQTNSAWIPLLDWVGWDNWSYNGVVSLATDAVDPNRVYAAVGMYTNSWDPNHGAVLRSSDKGATWQATQLPFKLGGNMPGRGMGERLAMDPNKDSVLYLGTPSGNGLWRSTDSGATWAKVTNFPNPGNYVADPSDTSGYQSDNQGIVWVTFDKSTSSSGATTKGVYVGVADKEQHRLPLAPTAAPPGRLSPAQPTGYIAHKGVLDPVNGFLYIATSDTGGPYDGGKGAGVAVRTATGTWTNISPVRPARDTYYGYSGLTVDRKHPGTIMVTDYSSWWPDTQIFRSTDSGATWTRAWDFTSYPDRSRPLHHGHLVGAVADLRGQPFAAGGHPEARLDDRVTRNRPVRLRPDDVRHRSHALRHQQPHRLGLRREDHPQADGGRDSRRPRSQELISPPSGAHLLSARSGTSAASSTTT